MASGSLEALVNTCGRPVPLKLSLPWIKYRYFALRPKEWGLLGQRGESVIGFAGLQKDFDSFRMTPGESGVRTPNENDYIGIAKMSCTDCNGFHQEFFRYHIHHPESLKPLRNTFAPLPFYLSHPGPDIQL
jgi:hypothetical protein